MKPSSLDKSSHNALPLSTNVFRQPIPVLYEDEHYVVFDKPAGLLVIPTAQIKQRTLVHIVNQQYSREGEGWKLHPCHRIDKETSGVVIFAKGKRSQSLMMGLFKKRAVTKRYIAFVHGKLFEKTGEFRNPIKKDVHKRMGDRQRGIQAITRYKVLETRKEFTVVEVWPVTGRKNQIRIHFSQAGHPLLGDRKFAYARDYALKFRRTALHAASLEWAHPVFQRRVSVQSDLPKDMAEFIMKH